MSKFNKNGIGVRCHMSMANTKQIIKLYTSGYGLRYVSRFIGCHRDVIKRILGENGVVIDTHRDRNMKAQIKTLMEKYGVTNCMHDETIRNKQFKNAFMLREFIINGKKYDVRGYEDRALKILVNERGYSVDEIENEDIPRIQYQFNGNSHFYYPDFYIKRENKVIEVKSEFTYMKDYDKNQAKFQKVKEDGYEFELMIL